MINTKEKDAKTLNKRLQWQIDYPNQGLHFVQLDINSLKLIVSIDVSFANNLKLVSQIGYIICLANTSNKANIIYWSSIKCKRVTRSVLASELYAMVHGFDVGAVLKSTTNKILDIKLLPMIVYTNFKSLFDCLVKLGSIWEKQFMVDLICF